MDFLNAGLPRTAGMVIALACLALTPAVASVAAGKDYKGIALLSLPPIPGITYDVDLVDPLPALQNITAALDVIYGESPFSAGKIEALIKNGRVEIIYDPNHPDPKTSMATVQVAKFVSKYKEMGRKDGKNYLAVVSRHGIKWPVRELAAVLVHELVGHGIQHLKNRFSNTRSVDLECEAWLYEENAYQDFRFDKSSREMIRFRQEMEGVDFTPGYCTEFKRHMQINTPKLMRFWDSINPDVPKLLEVFEDYLRDLRQMGVTGAVPVAVDELGVAEMEMIFNDGPPEDQYQIALSELRGKRRDRVSAAKWFQRAAEGGHARARYELAVMYEEGSGVAPDHVAAANWYRKAAQQNYAFAQYRLGRLYWYGRGVSKDYTLSAKWYRKAAERGHARSQTALGYLLVHGHGIAQDHAEAAKWYRNAADQGSALAQYRLGKLYSSGQGVVKDQYKAYFWLILAIERAQGKLKQRALDKKKRLINSLEPARISEIEGRARKWRPK